jgi:hypothetical protein
MIEPGLTSAGFRMIWNCLKWVFQRNKAPWSAADVSGFLRSNHEDGWHGCELRFVNRRQFNLEIAEVKTVKPSGLPICLVDNELGGQRDDRTEAIEARPMDRTCSYRSGFRANANDIHMLGGAPASSFGYYNPTRGNSRRQPTGKLPCFGPNEPVLEKAAS